MASDVLIDRDYSDNFSMKEYVVDNLIDKYFPDLDVNVRTTGMVALTSEQVTNIGEDTFNTGSVYFRETFPNRAQIPESIYSHAAIFQLSDVFSTAASCRFLLVMDENSIIKNVYGNSAYYDKSSGIYHFYIDKNTLIYIEDVPYTIDYDVQISIVVKKSETKTDYVFTAKYIMDQYKNSISSISSPYIKLRRSGDGFIAIEIMCHQCTRVIKDESITSSSLINYPVKDITFDGKLAGFDVLYKAASSSDYVQMEKRIVYSKETTVPFCFYQMLDEDTIRISFNSKDNYFMPEFNSDLRIILYITKGIDANFKSYNGTNIKLVPNNEVYDYANTYLTAAKPIGASDDGQDQLSLEGLQSLAVEGYRTANALTIENDLQEFFNNYKYRYGNSDILFIKKRDDVYERVFSAFVIMKNEEDIYNTNTLNLSLNLSEMEVVENGVYVLEPGFLFTANDVSGEAQFYRDPETTTVYYEEYLQAVADGTIPYVEHPTSELPPYLDRAASFAEFKRRKGVDDKRTFYELTEDQMKELDDPINNKFLLVNPFLIRFTKNPNLVSTYLTRVDNEVLLDFTSQNDPDEGERGTYVQFITYTFRMKREFEEKKRYELSLDLSPSIMVDDSYPIIDAIYDEDGDIVGYITNDPFDVVNNDLRVFAEVLDKDNHSACLIELIPTGYDMDNDIFTFGKTIYTDDHITSDNCLRILDGEIYRNSYNGDYFKATSVDEVSYNMYDENDNLLFENVVASRVTYLYNAQDAYWNRTTWNYYARHANDDKWYLYTADNEPVYMYIDNRTGNYYEPILTSTQRLYRKYNQEGEMIETDVPWDEIQELINEGYAYATQETDSQEFIENLVEEGSFEHFYLKKYNDVVNMTARDDILVPLDDVVINIYTLYRRVYDAETGALVIADESETDNPFVAYDFTLAGNLKRYIWTNKYQTATSPVTFIKPLDNVRTYLQFLDYTAYKEDGEGKKVYLHDIMDAFMYSIPFIRWTIVNDPDQLSYFLDLFYNQYEFITKTIIGTKLRTVTSIDMKFYNTYGRSRNFLIGEDNEVLDTVNLRIEFDIWFVSGTDTIQVKPIVRSFIRRNIEVINTSGYNNIFISNLMRKIELEFSYIDHIRFVQINTYSSDYQAVKHCVTDLNDLTVEERRWYVPEMLVVSDDNIIINDYFV